MTKHTIHEERSELRRRFVQAVKTADRVNGTYDVYTVDRETARSAFANWTYSQILGWASENGLTVDFGREGTLNLFDAAALNNSQGKKDL